MSIILDLLNNQNTSNGNNPLEGPPTKKSIMSTLVGENPQTINVGSQSSLYGFAPNPNYDLSDENTETRLNTDLEDWGNRFKQAWDETQKSAYTSKRNNAQNTIDKNVGNRVTLDYLLKHRKINRDTYDSRLEELSSMDIEASQKLKDAQEGIDTNQEEIDTEYVSKIYKLKEALANSKGADAGFGEALQYTMPSGLGSMGSMMAQQMIATFGKKALTSAVTRGLVAAGLGVETGPGALLIGAVATVGQMALLWNARNQESLSETGDAAEQAKSLLTEEWFAKNNPDHNPEGLQPSEEDLRKIRMTSMKGIDDLYRQNMMLLIPDALGMVIGSSLFKGSSIIKGLGNVGSYNKYTRVAKTATIGYTGMVGEKFEEGYQYAAGQRQSDVALGLANYQDKGFMKNVLTDATDTLASINYGLPYQADTNLGGKYAKNKEFQASSEVGGLLGLIGGGAAGGIAITRDINKYLEVSSDLKNKGVANIDDKVFKLKTQMYLKHFQNDTVHFLLEGVRNLTETKDEKGVPLMSEYQAQEEVKNIVEAHQKYKEVSEHLENIIPEGTFSLKKTEEQKMMIAAARLSLLHTSLQLTRHSKAIQTIPNINNINNLIEHQQKIVTDIQDTIAADPNLNKLYNLDSRLENAKKYLESFEKQKQSLMEEFKLTEKELPAATPIEESNKNKEYLIENLNLNGLQKNYEDLLKIKGNESLKKWFSGLTKQREEKAEALGTPEGEPGITNPFSVEAIVKKLANGETLSEEEELFRTNNSEEVNKKLKVHQLTSEKARIQGEEKELNRLIEREKNAKSISQVIGIIKDKLKYVRTKLVNKEETIAYVEGLLSETTDLTLEQLQELTDILDNFAKKEKLNTNESKKKESITKFVKSEFQLLNDIQNRVKELKEQLALIKGYEQEYTKQIQYYESLLADPNLSTLSVKEIKDKISKVEKKLTLINKLIDGLRSIINNTLEYLKSITDIILQRSNKLDYWQKQKHFKVLDALKLKEYIDSNINRDVDIKLLEEYAANKKQFDALEADLLQALDAGDITEAAYNKEKDRLVELTNKAVVLQRQLRYLNALITPINSAIKAEPVSNITKPNVTTARVAEIDKQLAELAVVPEVISTIDENPETINKPYYDGDPKKTSIYTTESGLDTNRDEASSRLFRYIENNKITDQKLLVVTKKNNLKLYNEILAEKKDSKEFEDDYKKRTGKEYEGIWVIITDKNGAPIKVDGKLLFTTLTTESRITKGHIIIKTGTKEQAIKNLNAFRAKLLSSNEQIFLPILSKSKGIAQLEAKIPGTQLRPSFNVLGRIADTLRNVPLFLSKVGIIGENTIAPKGKLYTRTPGGNYIDLIPRNVNQQEIGILTNLINQALGIVEQSVEKPTQEIEKLIFFGVKKEGADQFTIGILKGNVLQLGTEQLTKEQVNTKEGQAKIQQFLETKKVHVNNKYGFDDKFKRPTLITGDVDKKDAELTYKEYLLEGETPMFGTDLVTMDNVQFKNQYLNYENNVTVDEKLAPNPVPTTTNIDGNLVVTSMTAAEMNTASNTSTDTKADIERRRQEDNKKSSKESIFYNLIERLSKGAATLANLIDNLGGKLKSPIKTSTGEITGISFNQGESRFSFTHKDKKLVGYFTNGKWEIGKLTEKGNYNYINYDEIVDINKKYGNQKTFLETINKELVNDIENFETLKYTKEESNSGIISLENSISKKADELRVKYGNTYLLQDFLKQYDAELAALNNKGTTTRAKKDTDGLKRLKEKASSKRALTEREISWFKTKFPNILIEVVKGLIDGEAFGKFLSAGKVLLSDEATNGTLYHEAFHAVTQLYLSKKQIDALYKEAGEKLGTTDRLTIEEYLAEDFFKYKETGKILGQRPQRNTTFRKILDFIRALFRLDAKSIEEIYNRLDKGYYTNKDIVGVREFSTLNKLAGKSVAYSKQILDAIDAIFFERAFVNNLTPDEALDKSSALLGSTYNQILEREEVAKDEISKEAYNYIIDNWEEVSTTWQKRAAAIGIEIDLNEDPNKEQDEEAKGRDTAYGEANQVSAKSTLSSASKLLIRSLKQKNANGTDKLSDLNLPQVVEFGNTYNFLLKELSGLSSYSDIYNRIEELTKTRPEFKDLLDRIGKEGTATSQEKFIFQQQFRQDFAKNQVNSHTTVIEADGKIYIIENNKQSRIDKIREGWKNASRGIAKQVTTGQLIIEPSKELLGLANIPFLHAIGIDFSTETLPEVQDSQLITDTVKYIKDYIKEKNGDVTDLFSTKYGESPVSGRIDSLLELEAEFNPNVTELSYMSTEGKTIYSIGLNSMLSIIKNGINNTRANKEQIAAGLSDRDVLFARFPHLNTVGTEGSLWFSKLFSKDGFRREGINLELDLHDGLKTNNIKGGEFKQSTKGLSIGDKYVQEITSILMDGRSSYLRASDKSTEATFRLTKYAKGQKLAIPIADLAKGFDIQSVKEIFRGYFKSELKRIALFEIQGLGANIDVFGNTTDKDGKQVGNKGAKFTVFEGILDNKLKKSIYEQIQVLKTRNLSETELGVEIDNLYKQVQPQVDADVIKYLDTYTDELVKKIKEFKVDTNGISRELYKETSSEKQEDKVKQLMRAVAVNDYINSIEQTKLFIGDMAFYKDLFKRTAGATGTKETSSTGENIDNWLNANNTRKDKKLANGKVNAVIYEDVVVASSYVEEYKKALISFGYSPEEADILLKAYGSMDEGDAQGWITLDEYKEFALRRGVRNPKLYAAIDKAQKQIWKDGKLTNKETLLTKDEIASILILKAQYFGPQELNGLFAPAYHKYSLLPLVPQLVQGRNLEVMLNHMTANQNGYSLFKSGSKVGTPTNAEGKANSFYNENGEINTSNLQKQTIFYDFLGLQVKSSDVKDKVTFGTQFRKLLFSNAFGFGEEAIEGSRALLDEYNKIIDEIVEAAKAKLIKNLGINPASGKIEDATKLIALLRKEAEDRNLPDNIIDFLNTEIVDGLTVVENKLDASVNIAKINSMITSLVNSRLIKQKMNGDALIQVSSSGMESIGKRNIKEDKTYKFYTKNEDSTTNPAECAIPITGQYAFLLEQYGSLDNVNRAIRKGLIGKEILELVGYRIPTQGMNSIEYLTIKEFLPADSATAIILPSEIVAKSGGDFDVDKLNIFKPNLQFRNGEVVYVTKQSREQIGELYDLLKQRAINKELKKTDAASDKLLSAILGTDVTVLSEEDIYEILEEEKLPTNKEEFIKNFNHNKSRQNRIIEIAKQQISHPSNFTALITPNSTKILTDVVDDFRYYTDYLNRDRKENKEVMTKEEYLKSLKDNLSNIRYSDQLKLTTKIDQFHKFLLAKEMIGIAATANTHHILAQMVGMTLNPTYTVGGEKVSVKINLFDKSIGEELNIGRIKDAEGKHNISEVISQIINATVDAAKDPFFFDLNMSMETLGTQLYLIRLGVPYENVAYFMKQPIIDKYLKALAINKSGFLKGTKGAVLNNTQLEESIKKEYLSKEEREGLTSKILTTENLRSLLLKENQKSKEFNETQIQVLEDFLAYKEQSQMLGAAAKATNMDTAGLGKDIAVSERKITEILSVKEAGFVNNIDDVLQKTMIKSFNQHQFAIDVFSPLYHVQGSKKAVATRNAIMGTLNPFGAENTNKLSTLIDNDFINYVVQNYGYLGKEGNSIIEGVKKRLFTGENTPAKKLLDLKNKLNKSDKEQKLVDNMFIKELFPIIRNADRNQDNIKIYLKRYDTFTANQLTEAFREVGEIDLPLAKELYKELIDLGILQSGLNNSPITYLGILPQEYYAKIVKNAFKQFDKKSGVEDYKAYQQLFFRNNYSNSLVNNYAYKTGIKELGEGMFGKDYNKALYTAPATSVNTNNNKEGIQEISKDYGVVQVETNPTKELTQKFVDLIAPQVKAQTYKENVGQAANEMFHYGLKWGRKTTDFYVLKDGKYIKSTEKDYGQQLYSYNRYKNTYTKSDRKDLLAYKNSQFKTVKIDSYSGSSDMYAYDTLDQNGNPLPNINILQPIIDEIQSKLGRDMSDYDSVIGNIYVGNQYVYPHKDTTESKSARNYPVVVYTIGNNAGLGIVDNNKGKMTFANQYDKQWLPNQDKLKGYTNELVTHNGSIYTFGLDGNGRFELTHSTPINSNKTEKYPPLTLPNGEVITNYTITLTFRRAQDLEENTPKTPARTTPVVTNNTYTPTSKEVTEKPSDTQFSYKGKTINTEFKLGEEQEQALKDLIDFVDSGNKNHKESDIITLQGAAGTGKTSIIGYLEKYYKGSYSFAYLAPTHAATAELAFATVKSGNTVLPSTLMSSLTVNPRTKKSVFSAKIAKRLGFNPVVVIDESSMLDIQDINKLKEAIENVGGKLIYLGDEKQISKVVQGNVQNKSVSPAFTNFRQLSLTKIFRQSENSLLTLLSKMREQKSFKLFQVPNNESVKFLNRKEYNKELIKDLQTNSENTMIISYTNNAVKDLNDAARKVLGREGETKVGDIIVGYLGYASKQVEKADIANSINYTISNITTNGSVKTIEAKSSKLAKLIALGIKGIKETAYTNYYQLSSDDSLTFDDLTEKDFDSNNSDVSRIFKRVHEATTEYQNKTIGYGTYLDILAATSETLRKYSVGADYIYNPATNRMEKLDKNKHQSIKQNGQGSLLFSKDVDYGHAITIHKSQGSTIDNVYFDTSSLKAATNTPIIDSEGNQITTEKMSLAYVAMSRSKNKLVISIEDNDFEMLQVLKEAKAPVTKQEEQPYIVNEGESEDDETTESTQSSTSVERKTYSGRVTSLQPNQIFVFGSNPLGINGNPAKGTGGAALVAYNIAGVKQGEKMDNKLSDSGKAYGITTVTAPGKKRSKTPQEITEGIKKLYEFAKQNPTKEFLVSDYSATNLNGYTGQEMANMFNAAGPIPSNIVFNENFDKLVSTTQPTGISNVNNPADFTNHSGGAALSDAAWDIIGREFGVTQHRHYREPGQTTVDSLQLQKAGVQATPLDEKTYNEGQPKATIVARQMGRIEQSHQVRSNYIIRNWAQVKNADAIFAIGTIIPAGTSINNGKTALIEQVKGGTGYAVQMAINEGKPVFVYDGTKDSWFKWNGKTFEKTITPTLTKNFAGIGSRTLSTQEVIDKSLQAIRDVYANTFKSTQSSTSVDYNKAVQEANTRKPIAQNFFDGYRPNSDTSKVHTIRPEIVSKYKKGVKTITLVIDGIRTRSTRLANWMKENNPKVGDYFWQINEKNPEDKVLTRITAVYGKSDSRFKDNWFKEGWIDSNFEYVKDYDSAIEFEVVTPTQSSTSVKEGVTVTRITPKNKELPVYELDKTMTNMDGTKRFASTVGGNTVRINPPSSMEEFFNYFEGKDESKTSTQKGLVLFELSMDGYSLARIKSILNTRTKVITFLILHEKSHIDNKDADVYWKQGKENLNTQDKIDIEARATLEAIKKIEQMYSNENKYKSQLDELMTEAQGLPADYQEKVAELIKNSKVTNDEELGDLKNKICNIGLSL